MASYKFSISFGVDIIQSMIVNFNVCGFFDFHEGNFKVDCNDNVQTLIQLCDCYDRLAAAGACTVRKHH